MLWGAQLTDVIVPIAADGRRAFNLDHADRWQ